MSEISRWFIQKNTIDYINEGHSTTKFSKSVYLSIKSLVTLKYAKRNHIQQTIFYKKVFLIL